MPANNSLKVFHPMHIDGLQRMGHTYDGGYVVHYPSLADADCLVNYGIGYNTDFEQDFFKATGKPTLAFDPTLKDLRPIVKKFTHGQFIPFLRHLKNYLVWKRDQNKLKNYRISYIEEGIAVTDYNEYKSFRYHFERHGLKDKKFIFKIDVEGAEFGVFADDSIYPLLPNAIQIIIEFHELNKHMKSLEEIMHKLLKTHSLVHIHANNHAGTFPYHDQNVPEAIEVTFILNKYLAEKEYSTVNYPIPGLDRPCNKKKADIPLDFFY